MLGAIRNALYSRYGEFVDKVSDKIDALEVMAEMLGYNVEVDWDLDGCASAYFYIEGAQKFKMRLSAIVAFTMSSTSASERMRQLKIEGKVRSVIELVDGLDIAQSLL